jgi:hypothetical protein
MAEQGAGLTGQAKEKTDKRFIKSVCHPLALRNFIRLLHSLTFPLGLMLVVFSIDIPRLLFLHQLLHVLPEMDLLKFLHQVGLTN